MSNCNCNFWVPGHFDQNHFGPGLFGSGDSAHFSIRDVLVLVISGIHYSLKNVPIIIHLINLFYLFIKTNLIIRYFDILIIPIRLFPTTVNMKQNENWWTKEQTKELRSKPMISFMSGPSKSLTPDPPVCRKTINRDWVNH